MYIYIYIYIYINWHKKAQAHLARKADRNQKAVSRAESYVDEMDSFTYG